MAGDGRLARRMSREGCTLTGSGVVGFSSWRGQRRPDLLGRKKLLLNRMKLIISDKTGCLFSGLAPAVSIFILLYISTVWSEHALAMLT